MDNATTESKNALGAWFRELIRGPVEPYGDYYDRLRSRVESSAPVAGCG